MVNVGIRRWQFWVVVVGGDGERVVVSSGSDAKRCNNRYPTYTPIVETRLSLSTVYSRHGLDYTPNASTAAQLCAFT